MLLATWLLFFTTAAGVFFSIVRYTKKHELYIQSCNDILAWHKEVVVVLMEIKHLKRLESCPELLFTEKLARLSAFIEVGRFYFPNLHYLAYGCDKPSAYRGIKDQVLEFLVHFYEEARKEQFDARCLEHIQRQFTSAVFSQIKPHELKLLKAQFSVKYEDTLIAKLKRVRKDATGRRSSVRRYWKTMREHLTEKLKKLCKSI